MKLFSTLSAGALALGLAIPAVRPAAEAPAALAVTSLYCEDVGGGGIYYNVTNCWATTSGGAGGNSYDWDVIVNYQADSGNSSFIEGVCTDSYPVSITVTDAAGATATRSQTFRCYAKSTGGGIEP